MILADKIINERKKNGWSQEELADKLGVSRQSVSKWEGAQSVPDIQKIIQMAAIFEVSTDYLLKDELETVEAVVVAEENTDEEVVRVNMEEANEYIDLEKKYSPWVANATSLCIACPVLLIFLAGYSESFGKISENLAAGIGVVALFMMIIAAVGIFLKTDNVLSKFDVLKEKKIDTAYGVTGMVKERQKAAAHKNEMLIIVGVTLCIGCAIPLLIAAFAEASDFILICMVCILLLTIAIAVNIFVRVDSMSECYKVLLQEGDFTSKKKKSSVKFRPFSRIYWSLATAIYLGWSFIIMDWKFTWVVWPVAGVLYVVYKQIVMLCVNAKE